jgi:hypothetical protein
MRKNQCMHVNVAALYPNCVVGNELMLCFEGDHREGNKEKKNSKKKTIEAS